MSESEQRDPLFEELDEVRQRIWDECDQDLDKYFAMLVRCHQQLLREGWVEAPPRDAPGKSAA